MDRKKWIFVKECLFRFEVIKCNECLGDLLCRAKNCGRPNSVLLHDKSLTIASALLIHDSAFRSQLRNACRRSRPNTDIKMWECLVVCTYSRFYDLQMPTGSRSYISNVNLLRSLYECRPCSTFLSGVIVRWHFVAVHGAHIHLELVRNSTPNKFISASGFFLLHL